MTRENLDLVSEIYASDPYERENQITETEYVKRCTEYTTDRSFWLELGLGHGYVLEGMSRANEAVLALEGSPELVRRYHGLYGNVEIKLTYFEDFEDDRKFANIGMGFVLEHVEDPERILQKFRRMLTEHGSMFVAVPNASSLHRRIAQRAGLLDDIRMMSDTDRRLGHKRFLTCADWLDLFSRLNFRIDRAEGLYLKPLTTSQLNSLDLDPRVYTALAAVAKDLPHLANSCLFVLKND